MRTVALWTGLAGLAGCQPVAAEALMPCAHCDLALGQVRMALLVRPYGHGHDRSKYRDPFPTRPPFVLPAGEVRHTRSADFDLGSARLTLRGERTYHLRHSPAEASLGPRESLSMLSGGLRYEVHPGGGDRLALTLAGGVQRQRSAIDSAGRWSVSRHAQLGVEWADDDHWRLLAGYTIVQGDHRFTSSHRAIELALGAPPGGRGPGFGIDFSPARLGARRPLTIGLQASDDRLSAADALAYDAGTNSDRRLTAYLRKAF